MAKRKKPAAKRKKPGAQGRTGATPKRAPAKHRKAAAASKTSASPKRASPKKLVAPGPDMPPRRGSPTPDITSWQGNSDQVAADIVRNTAELRQRQHAALVEAQNAIAELRPHLPLGPIETKDIEEAEEAVAELQERPEAEAPKSKLKNIAEKFKNAVQDDRVKQVAGAIERTLRVASTLYAAWKLFTGSG